jgi:endonuclease/exonuclease/phosphatase (EEP) superfamily protein YafD
LSSLFLRKAIYSNYWKRLVATNKVAWWLKALRMLFFALGCFPAMFIIMTLLAEQFVICEICCHFWMQYLCAIAISVIGLLLLKQARAAAVLAPFLLIAIVQVAPLYIPQTRAVPKDAATLSLMAFNVNTANQHYDDVANYILSADPDVVSIEEVSDKWLQHLHPVLAKKYPYNLSHGQDDNFGIAMYSKYPFTKSVIDPLFKPEKFIPSFPTAIAQIDVGGKPVTLVAVHPPPPISGLALLLRTRCMSEYEGILRKWSGDSGRYVLMGDLNCTPWSPYFSRFVSEAGLSDTARGFGFVPSWPNGLVLISTPIDHILVSKGFRTLARGRGLACGSDHYAIYANLAIVD